MDAAQWTTLGGVAVAIVTSVGTYLRVKPEARKLQADAGTQIGNAGLAMAREDRERLDKLQAAMDAMRHRELARDQQLIRHASWDNRMMDRVRAALPDVPFEDPPPLFLPGTH